jgi:hypothetical protein
MRAASCLARSITVLNQHRRISATLINHVGDMNEPVTQPKSFLAYEAPRPCRRFPLRFVLGSVVVWVVLMTANAVYMLVMPHGPHFAPELGPRGAFLVFTFAYSIPYFLAVVIVVAVLWVFALLTRRPRERK